jgi:transcription elongation factor GreA
MAAEETIPVTPEGHVELTEELRQLKDVARPAVITAIAEARAHGDLKENAEYAAAKEQQSFIEGRIKELESSLSRAKIIDFRGQVVDQVRIGAYVTVSEEESGDVKTLRVVGDLEADITKNKISLSSPLAKALLGKQLNDLVEVKVPKGNVEYLITEIRY